MKHPKPFQYVLATALALSCLASSAVYAQRSTAADVADSAKKGKNPISPNLRELITVRGNENRGGDGIPVNGELRLLDLIDPTVCDWKPGSKVLAEVPAIQLAYTQILASLSRRDWYLPFVLDRETKSMPVCKTRFLRRIWTNDSLFEAVVVPFALSSRRQLAIRDYYNGQVFLDTDATSPTLLRPSDFPYLMLHEAAHSFVDGYLPRYYMRLRTFIYSLNRLATNQIGREDFEYSNRQVGLVIPPVTPLRQRMESQIRFALASTEQKTALLAASNEPAELLLVDRSDLAVTGQLLGEDAQKIYQLASDPFKAAVIQVCLSENRDLMSRIQASADRLRPFEYDFAGQCLALAEIQEDRSYSAFLSSISQTPKVVEKFLRELSTKSLVLTDDEIRVTEPYRWLALTTAMPDELGQTPYRELRRLQSSIRFGAVEEGFTAFDRKTRLAFDSIATMIRWMRPQEIFTFFATPAVTQAFVLSPSDLAKVQQMSQHNRMILTLSYPHIVRSFRDALQTHLTERLLKVRNYATDATITGVLNAFDAAATQAETQLKPYQPVASSPGVQK